MPYTKSSGYIDAPLCAKEAADMVGCSYRRLLQLRTLGIVRGYQLVQGGHWHFDRLDLQLLKEQLKAAAPARPKKPPGGRYFCPDMDPGWRFGAGL